MSLKNKLINIIFLTVIILPILAIKTYAATGTFSVTPSTIQLNVSGTAQITINANECAGQFNIVSSDPNVASVNSTGDFLDNSSKILTVTANNPGNATITVIPADVTDTSEKAVTGSKTVNITVNTTQQQNQTQTTEPTQPVVQDPTFTSTNKTMYTTGNVNLRSSWSTASAATLVNAGTELTVTGTSTEKVNGYVWYRVSYNGQTKYIASGLLTSTKPAEEDKDKDKEEDKEDEKKTDEKSTNKALKDLVVENYKLTPDFDPETTKYTIDVTKEVEKLEITPILQDDKSKFEITGNENFKVGNNIVKITVTAEDGTNRIYTITVAKSNKEGEDDAAEEGLKLSKLQIKDLTLDPEFKPETTNYSVVVSDPTSIKIADITAIAKDEDVEVTIAEAEADKNGNRVITIMLENEDGTKSGVYQITIKKGMINPIAELQKNKNNRIYYILGGIIGVLVIAIIVVIVLLKKTSNKDDIQDIKDADELSDDYDYSLKNAIDNAKSEETPEYDEMVEDSNVKSQILTNPKDYNVFEDEGDGVGVSDETKRYNMSNDDDFKPKGKKKGKHF